MSGRIIERDFGDGLVWYIASVQFATSYMARQAWEHVERKVSRGSLGLYRHGPTENPGTIVSCVSLDRAQLLRCARLLRTGEDYALDETTMRALCARRARVVLEHARGGESGRMLLRRPEGRGAEMTKDGRMIEPIGGDE